MAIQFPVSGSIFYTQFSPTSVAAILDAIKNALVNCGWTSANRSQVTTLTYSSNPGNGQTVTIAGQTYRFVTSLAGCSANDVLIGAGASNTAQNLNDAINGSPGSGTEWCASTSANASCTSTVSSATLTLTGSTGGSGGAFSVSGTGTATNTQCAGYQVTMPATPQFLRCSVILENIPGNTTSASIRLAMPDLSLYSGTVGSTGGGTGVYWISVSGARTLEFAGCGHQFMIFMLNDFDATAGTVFFMTVPYIRVHNTGVQISGATNASPIVITATAHGRTTGDDIFIADVQGNSAANGFWNAITVIDANTISLPGSTGSGAYTSGGVLASYQQVARCWFAVGCDQGNARTTFRSVLNCANTSHLLNQWFYSQLNQNNSGMVAPTLLASGSLTGGFDINSWGNIPDLVEPRIYWAVSSVGSTTFTIGQFWASFLVGEMIPGDRINTGFDGHNWVNILNNYTGISAGRFQWSLWLAKT